MLNSLYNIPPQNNQEFFNRSLMVLRDRAYKQGLVLIEAGYTLCVLEADKRFFTV